MSRVTLSGHIKVPASDLSAVLAELPMHIELTRDEPGCLVFEVTADPDQPTSFRVYEQFVDPAAFVAHQERVRSSAWGSVTMNVERHYEVTGMPD